MCVKVAKEVNILDCCLFSAVKYGKGSFTFMGRIRLVLSERFYFLLCFWSTSNRPTSYIYH